MNGTENWDRFSHQIARDVTMADWGSLEPGQHLIHDRDGKFFPVPRVSAEYRGGGRDAGTFAGKAM